MKSLIFISFLFSLFLTTGCATKTNKIYTIWIGTSSDYFNDDTTASAGGEDIDGEILVSINGNPVDFYRGWGKILQVNQYLKKEQNSITLTGSSSKNIYLKVTTTDSDGSHLTVLSKKEIRAHTVITESLSFNADIDYNLPLFSSHLNETQSELLTLEKTISKIKKMASEKKEEPIANCLLEGTAIWLELAYSRNWAELQNVHKKRVKMIFFSHTKKISDFDLNNVKVIWGTNMAFVYSESNHPPNSDNPYIFKFGEKGDIFYPPLLFIKLDNKWIVWK